MSEPWPDALFGVDGTEPPTLSDRDRQPDAAMPPPFVLPPIPFGMTREEVAAELDAAESQRLVDQDLAAAVGPTAAGAAQASGAASAAGAAPVAAAAQASPAAQPTIPLPAAGAADYNPRSVMAARVTPVQSLPRSSGGLRYHQQLIARSRSLEQLRNTRRRVARRLPTHTRSNGGAGAFFFAVSIMIMILLYFVISGIVEAIARLIP
jgi:ABC-type Na+ efflux pump permease subunit